MTYAGTVAGLVVGLVAGLAMLYMGPLVQMQMLGRPAPIIALVFRVRRLVPKRQPGTLAILLFVLRSPKRISTFAGIIRLVRNTSGAGDHHGAAGVRGDLDRVATDGEGHRCAALHGNRGELQCQVAVCTGRLASPQQDSNAVNPRTHR